MAQIRCIKARQVLGSRGNSTIKVNVNLDNGTFAQATLPSGASAEIYEAIQPVHDVSQAVKNINKIIAPALIGMDPTEQAAIDNFMVQELDGTVNEWGWCKQQLGANAILAVSLAICKAGAAVNKIPLYKHIANLAGNSRLVLPVPAFKVINGGSDARNKLAMQEMRIFSVEASSLKEAMEMGVEVYDHFQAVIKKKYSQDATQRSDTGGFIQENEEALGWLKEAIENADYTGKVLIGMDAAASEFYRQDEIYDMNFREENNDGTQRIPGYALGNVYSTFAADFDVVSIENPFDPADLKHYAMMTEKFGEHIQIVGGDLWGNYLVRAINEKTCNALLLKVDQMGSVTEIIEGVKMSKAAGWGVIASCSSLGRQRSTANIFLPKMFRCGECTKLCSAETEDAFIADFSVGLATLLQIEKELGEEAVYAGADFRKPVEPY